MGPSINNKLATMELFFKKTGFCTSKVKNLIYPILNLGKIKILHLPRICSKGQYIYKPVCQEREILKQKTEVGIFKKWNLCPCQNPKLATNFSFSRIISFILTVGNVERWYLNGGCMHAWSHNLTTVLQEFWRAQHKQVWIWKSIKLCD